MENRKSSSGNRWGIGKILASAGLVAALVGGAYWTTKTEIQEPVDTINIVVPYENNVQTQLNNLDINNREILPIVSENEVIVESNAVDIVETKLDEGSDLTIFVYNHNGTPAYFSSEDKIGLWESEKPYDAVDFKRDYGVVIASGLEDMVHRFYAESDGSYIDYPVVVQGDTEISLRLPELSQVKLELVDSLTKVAVDDATVKFTKFPFDGSGNANYSRNIEWNQNEMAYLVRLPLERGSDKKSVGQYHININSGEHLPKEFRTVPPIIPEVIRIELDPGARFYGRVVDENTMEGVSNATVDVLRDDWWPLLSNGVTPTVITDKDGYFIFRNIDPMVQGQHLQRVPQTMRVGVDHSNFYHRDLDIDQAFKFTDEDLVNPGIHGKNLGDVYVGSKEFNLEILVQGLTEGETADLKVLPLFRLDDGSFAKIHDKSIVFGDRNYEGQVEMDGVKTTLPPGEYLANVSMGESYPAGREFFTVNQDGQVIVPWDRGVSVTGTLFGVDNYPLSNGRVGSYTFVDDDLEGIETNADENGNFRLNLRYGERTITGFDAPFNSTIDVNVGNVGLSGLELRVTGAEPVPIHILGTDGMYLTKVEIKQYGRNPNNKFPNGNPKSRKTDTHIFTLGDMDSVRNGNLTPHGKLTLYDDPNLFDFKIVITADGYEPFTIGDNTQYIGDLNNHFLGKTIYLNPLEN